MACTCRGSDPGVVLRGGVGISVRGTGTPASPLVIDSNLAESLVLEAHDSATVNFSLSGIGTLDDPYVLSADTASAMTLTGLGDVISAAPDAGAVPTWVPASGGRPGHWEFIVPTLVSSPSSPSGPSGPGVPSTWSATALTGIVPDVNLPARLSSTSSALPTGTNLNTVVSSGWYRGIGITNAPDTTQWWYVEVIGSSSVNVFQTAYRMSGDETYRRRLINGTWSAWTRVLSRTDVDAGYLDNRYPHIGGTNVITDAMLPMASCAGTAQISATTADGGGFSGQVAIKFPPGRFPDNPQVFFGVSSGASQSQHIGVKPGTLTKDGMTIYYWRANSTNPVEVYWLAYNSRNS